MVRRNIAIIGKMGAGKTTVTDYLADNHGYLKFVLSTPLKLAAVALWGESMKIDRGRGISLGKWVQHEYPDALVDAFKRTEEIHKRHEETHGYAPQPRVVEAPRYPSDYEGVAEMGYMFVEVWCPESQRVDRLQRAGHGRLNDVSQVSDETETALDDRSRFPVEHIIHTNKPLDEVYADIDAMLAKEDAKI